MATLGRLVSLKKLKKTLIGIGIAILAFLVLYPLYLAAATNPFESNPVIIKQDILVPIVVVSNAQTEKVNEFNRIAQCESGGNLRAKNKYSSASGEYQFIWGTWHHYGLELWGDEFYEKNIWSDDNRELAWYVYSKYGSKDWNASKYCWSKPSTVASNNSSTVDG